MNGKLHSEIDIIGLARGPDGTVAARFSDAVKLDFKDNDELRKFQEKPIHYENQFEIAPGTYTFAAVFTAGSQQFGKLERPLVIEPYDEKSLAIGGLAMGSDSAGPPPNPPRSTPSCSKIASPWWPAASA